MTIRYSDQRGFSFISLLVIVVVLGVVVFAGFKVYEIQQTKDAKQASNSQSSSVTEDIVTIKDVPDKIETAGDLSDTEKLLDNASTESDTSSIDADLSSF